MVWIEVKWNDLIWFINQILCLELIIKIDISIDLEINYYVWNLLKLKLI